jgi:hypothetical protein
MNTSGATREIQKRNEADDKDAVRRRLLLLAYVILVAVFTVLYFKIDRPTAVATVLLFASPLAVLVSLWPELSGRAEECYYYLPPWGGSLTLLSVILALLGALPQVQSDWATTLSSLSPTCALSVPVAPQEPNYCRRRRPQPESSIAASTPTAVSRPEGQDTPEDTDPLLVESRNRRLALLGLRCDGGECAGIDGQP